MEEIKKDYSKVDYRFSYVLSVNDLENDLGELIICKRDFDINNFDETSVRSLELKEAIDDIVNLIDRDLKSKSRVYTWCNMPMSIERHKNGKCRFGVYNGNDSESKDVSDEFKTPISEHSSTLKFTFFDRNKPIISKIWSGDYYPPTIRNSVDLTNKKFKYDNINIQALDFPKSINQRASADRQDLTYIIMKHISSVCASYYSNEYGKRVIYKQYLPDLVLDEIIFTDLAAGKYEYVNNKVESICRSTDENRGVEKVVYGVYTNEINVGGKKTYKNTTPVEDWEDDVENKSTLKQLIKRK